MSGIIAYLYYKEEVSTYNNKLLYEMREYNFDFKGKKFDATIINAKKDQKTDILYTSQNEIYTLFRIPKINTKFLKIVYPKDKYQEDIDKIEDRVLAIFAIVIFLLFLLSLFYASYALSPMKKAINLVEDFLKDIIHDINTPITTILLNTKFLKSNNPSDELQRIELSAKRILSLYKNFEMDTKKFQPQLKKVNIYVLIKEKVDYFQKLYPAININITGKAVYYKTDMDAFERIIDNLISNACKYTINDNPQIDIEISKKNIYIKDNGAGIKDISKIYSRFYKESDRGIGIGLNIVKKFCNALNIDIDIKSQIKKGTIVKLTLN
jgi:two-component system OmpR family sensor kinase